MTHNNLGVWIILPIFIWSIYRRIKRSVGRQRLRLWRVLLSLIIFSALAILFATQAWPLSKLLTGLFGGMATGIPLAFWGLKLTRFEFTNEGHFYTPNLYIGLGLSASLAGRIIYRILVLNNQVQSIGSPPPQFMQSALTLYFFGVTAGYYLTYYTGVLWRYQRNSSEIVHSS